MVTHGIRVLGLFGFVWALAEAAHLCIYPQPTPPIPWIALSLAAASGWMLCSAGYVMTGRRLSVDSAALCGLLAGAFASSLWLSAPGPAVMFRLAIPLALLQSIGRRDWLQQASRAWFIAGLVLLALGADGNIVDLCTMATSLMVVFAYSEYRLHMASRLATHATAACFSSPCAIAIINYVVAPVGAWAMVVYAAVFMLILRVTLDGLGSALLPPGIHFSAQADEPLATGPITSRT